MDCCDSSIDDRTYIWLLSVRSAAKCSGTYVGDIELKIRANHDYCQRREGEGPVRVARALYSQEEESDCVCDGTNAYQKLIGHFVQEQAGNNLERESAKHSLRKDYSRSQGFHLLPWAVNARPSARQSIRRGFENKARHRKSWVRRQGTQVP